MQITVDKEALRNRFRRERKTVTPEQQLERDNEILFRLLIMPEYRRSTAVFTYVSKPGEVSTRLLIQAAWANKKCVAVPKWDAEGNMIFYRVNQWDQLKPGKFGVLEPDDTCLPVPMPSKSALCIVPGLSFDADGYRLGYGKGCYDRFLPGFAGMTIGLCPASAMVLKLPRSKTDCPVDLVITEQYIRRSKAAANNAI